MHQSVWHIDLPVFRQLEGDIKTDVLIIGGGMSGLLCAYYLHQAGISYVLVERSSIVSGITKNTTAKITSQHGLIYDKIIREYGTESAQMYLSANEKALAEFRNLSKKINCDFKTQDAYTFSLEDREKLEDEFKALRNLRYDAELLEKTNLPFETKGAICFKNQAQFHPLKFIAELAKDLHIYENTFVTELVPGGAVTQKGKITAEKIIVATHFPFLNKHGSYFLKLYQHRSYVTAFEGAALPDGMYVDEDKKGISLRHYENLLLIGGEGHRTGKKSRAWQGIDDFAKQFYPEAKARYRWASQDCMSLDGIPYIGQYAKGTPNLFVATGFNKWGMTSSMVSAMVLSELVQEKRCDFAEVFSPQRSMLKPQLFVNGIESTANLLTISKKRCPHLGCALKWNKEERSWDCPCHGSRFEENGKLIDNPAMGNLKK